MMLENDKLYLAFKHAAEHGAISMVHAENGELMLAGQRKMLDLGVFGPEGHTQARPPYMEAEAVRRAAAIAKLADAPLYIVHVNSKEAMQEGN